VETHTDPAAVVAAVGRLLQPIEAGSGPTLADHDDLIYAVVARESVIG
jgi:hypothetical protein